MSNVKRRKVNVTNTIFLLGTPIIALVGVPWYVATRGVGMTEILTFLFLWIAIAVSVTAGYHRLFSHRAYQARWPVKLFFLLFGAAAFENSVLQWCADHREHHTHVDGDKDPYNIKKGFWWAHIGWIFFDVREKPLNLVKDLQKDKLVMWQDRNYHAIALSVAIGIPLLVGILTGKILGAILFGVFLRIVVTHHVTFFINSLCHMIGFRPYSLEHSGRDSTIMAVLAFGEGYHNYHHTFPYDYRNGVRSWQLDPAKWTIWALSLFGLTSNLKRASKAHILKAKVEVQLEKARRKGDGLVHDMREQYNARLHEAYENVASAIEAFQLAYAKKSEQATERYREMKLARKEFRRTVRMLKRAPATMLVR